jgi:hypothetical protein
MIRKIYSLIAVFAFICLVNAQVNVVSDSIQFRDTSKKAKRTWNYGSMEIQGQQGDNALNVTYTGTTGGVYIGVKAYSAPTTSSGYGGQFTGGAIGVKGVAGSSSSTASAYGGHFIAYANNSANITSGLYATCSGSGSSQQYACYFVGNTWCTNGTWSGSDSLIKTNVEPLANSLQKVMCLQPKKYEFDVVKYPKLGFDRGKKLGLLAQNVESVVPEAVKDVAVPTENQSNGITTIKSINYTELIPLLIGAIQEQQKEMDELKQALSAK